MSERRDENWDGEGNPRVVGETDGFQYQYFRDRGRDLWLWSLRGPGLERYAVAASEWEARQAIQRELCLASPASF